MFQPPHTSNVFQSTNRRFLHRLVQRQYVGRGDLVPFQQCADGGDAAVHLTRSRNGSKQKKKQEQTQSCLQGGVQQVAVAGALVYLLRDLCRDVDGTSSDGLKKSSQLGSISTCAQRASVTSKSLSAWYRISSQANSLGDSQLTWKLCPARRAAFHRKRCGRGSFQASPCQAPGE